jgi:hypothetical protein
LKTLKKNKTKKPTQLNMSFCFWSAKQTRHTNRIQRRVIKLKEIERLRLFEEPHFHAPRIARVDHCDNLEPESPKNDQKSETQKQRDGYCCSL